MASGYCTRVPTRPSRDPSTRPPADGTASQRIHLSRSVGNDRPVSLADQPISPRRRVRPTLQTVADVVGVSRTTVSNAYSRPDQLASGLRTRILGAAAELGYAGPHPVARRLRGGTAGAIGLLFTEELSYAFDDPAAVLFLAGVAETLQAQDVGLLLLPARPTVAFDEGAVRDAVVDGFIVYSVSDSHPGMTAVLDRRLPTVVVDQPRGRGVSFVGIDDSGGAERAATHLVELGHRRLAVLTDRLSATAPGSPVTVRRDRRSDYRVARSRLSGYRRAIERAGLSWADVMVIECFPNTPGTGALATDRLLAGDHPPTAIIGMTDQLAIGALQSAAAHGLDVPERLSVVGFDDIPAAALSRPLLTTVRQPLREKGRVAARLLLVADDDNRARRSILSTELVIRESTAPPAAGSR